MWGEITPPRSFAPTLPLKGRVESANLRLGDLDAEALQADIGPLKACKVQQNHFYWLECSAF
ncbi:hypothetical protein CCGE532_04935 [Rhizobium sp. CCGE532]|nr:hypothetical protein CCGE532_04935 [Rhizobium sp. CCGE532]